MKRVSNSGSRQGFIRKLTDRAVMYVGFECNANCDFCYYKHMKPEKRKWINIIKLKAQARLFREKYNNKSVDITGGEPTLHPEITSLVSYCHEIGLEPTLITNGIKIADIEFLKQLKEAGLSDLLISVQGYKSEMDGITHVKGHYKKIDEALDNCGKLGIPFRTNTVLIKKNYKSLPKIAEYVTKKGAKVVNFISFNPYYDWGSKGEIDIQEKHSVIAPYLSKAIDIVESKGVECNVRYFPFCMLPERQRHTIMNWMQLPYDRHEWDFASWYRWTNEMQMDLLIESGFRQVFSTNKFDGLYNTFALRIRRDLYYKPTKCYTCAAKNICDGLNKQYYNRYGQYELEPIKKMFGTKDPMYFKIRNRGEENESRKG